MTDPNREPGSETEADLERLEEDREAMDRPDRAIPLPDERADPENDGVGEVTGLVP